VTTIVAADGSSDNCEKMEKTTFEFVDIGCGDGRVVEKVAKKLLENSDDKKNSHWRCLGVDYDIVQVARAQKKIANAFDEVIFHKLTEEEEEERKKIEIRQQDALCPLFAKYLNENVDFIFVYVVPKGLAAGLGDVLRKYIQRGNKGEKRKTIASYMFSLDKVLGRKADRVEVVGKACQKLHFYNCGCSSS